MSSSTFGGIGVDISVAVSSSALQVPECDKKN
jgi:hypothetical protein